MIRTPPDPGSPYPLPPQPPREAILASLARMYERRCMFLRVLVERRHGERRSEPR